MIRGTGPSIHAWEGDKEKVEGVRPLSLLKIVRQGAGTYQIFNRQSFVPFIYQVVHGISGGRNGKKNASEKGTKPDRITGERDSGPSAVILGGSTSLIAGAY